MLTSNLPIMVLVKYGDYEVAAEALKAGAQDFLTKPVASERVRTTLRNLLHMRDVSRELEWFRRDRIGNNGHTTKATGSMSFSLMAEDGNIQRIEDLEKQAILHAMQIYNGRMTEVARRLGIGRSTLYRKLNDFSARQSEAA